MITKASNIMNINFVLTSMKITQQWQNIMQSSKQMRYENINKKMKKYENRFFKKLKKLLTRIQKKIFVSIWLIVNSFQIYEIRDDIRDSELIVLFFVFYCIIIINIIYINIWRKFFNDSFNIFNTIDLTRLYQDLSLFLFFDINFDI